MLNIFFQFIDTLCGDNLHLKWAFLIKGRAYASPVNPPPSLPQVLSGLIFVRFSNKRLHFFTAVTAGFWRFFIAFAAFCHLTTNRLQPTTLKFLFVCSLAFLGLQYDPKPESQFAKVVQNLCSLICHDKSQRDLVGLQNLAHVIAWKKRKYKYLVFVKNSDEMT